MRSFIVELVCQLLQLCLTLFQLFIELLYQILAKAASLHQVILDLSVDLHFPFVVSDLLLQFLVFLQHQNRLFWLKFEFVVEFLILYDCCSDCVTFRHLFLVKILENLSTVFLDMAVNMVCLADLFYGGFERMDLLIKGFFVVLVFRSHSIRLHFYITLNLLCYWSSLEFNNLRFSTLNSSYAFNPYVFSMVYCNFLLAIV